MFRDIRFSGDGSIPTERRLEETYRLSNDRSIYIRLTSPHENDENLEGFFDKILTRIRRPGRWNFAGPLQPNQFNRMPGLVEVVAAFVNRFSPERLRVVFLSPDRNGDTIDTNALLDQLRTIEAEVVEVCAIDARDREWNGLFLADFFDFT